MRLLQGISVIGWLGGWIGSIKGHEVGDLGWDGPWTDSYGCKTVCPLTSSTIGCRHSWDEVSQEH
jgi:hypothetical protein